MENYEVTVLDIMAQEGLGSFAFELETLHPDLYSVSTAKLLATMMEESHRLQSWPHQPPEQASKCLRLSFRALRGNEIMQLRKIHAFFLLSRHLRQRSATDWLWVYPGKSPLRKKQNIEVL